MNKHLWFMILLLLLGSCAKKNREIVILETSDVHGTLFSFDFLQNRIENQGYLAAATIIDSVRNVYGEENVLYIDCGDLLQGNPLTDYYNFYDTLTLHPMISILNDLRADAFIVGNHDIEQGKPVWKRTRKLSDFPWLAANVVSTKNPDSLYFEPFQIFERSGIKLMVFGLITPAIPNWLPEEIYHGMNFIDMDESVQKWLPQISGKYDVLIGAFHSGVNPEKGKTGYPETLAEENASGQIAQNYHQFGAILSGHEHKTIPEEPMTYSKESVPVLMPSSKAERVGFLKITFREKNGGIEILEKEIKNIPVNGKMIPPELETSYQKVREVVQNVVETPIGSLAQPFLAEESRNRDTPIMDFIHKIQMDLCDAQISLAASFKTDLEIPEGEVNRKSVFSIYPYENTLYKLKIRGRDLVDHLEKCSDYFIIKSGSLEINKDIPGYNFDIAEGINYRIILRENLKPMIKVLGMTSGKNFRLEEYYTLAVNSYRAQQLIQLYHCEVLWKSALSMRDYIEQYFKFHSPVHIKENNNWKIIIKK